MRRKRIELQSAKNVWHSQNFAVIIEKISGCLRLVFSFLVTVSFSLLSLPSIAMPHASAAQAGIGADTDRQQKSPAATHFSAKRNTGSDREIVVGPDQTTVSNSASQSGTPLRPQSTDDIIVRKMNSGIAADQADAVAEPVARPAADGKTSLHELKGQVRDASTGLPLVGAIVKLARASFGILTDDKGCFTLHNAPEKSNLIVKYIGYQPKKIKPESDFVQVFLDPAPASQH